MERRGNKSGHQNMRGAAAIPLGLTLAMSGACISRTKTVTVAARDVVDDVSPQAEIQKLARQSRRLLPGE